MEQPTELKLCYSCQMLHIKNHIKIPLNELDIQGIRAQGPGGQNVNKVSSAVQIRFDIKNSSLSPTIKNRLLSVSDQRLTKDGEFILKCQNSRSYEKNKLDGMERLKEWILENTKIQKPRKETKPTKASQRKRQDEKSKRGEVKNNRKRIDY